jgi:hypothetical protein
MKRLGRVVFDLGYVVDLDDREMIEEARTSIVEDIYSAIKYGELDQYIEIRDDPEATADEADIAEFLLESAEERNAEKNSDDEHN